MNNKEPYFKKFDKKIKVSPTSNISNKGEWPESWKRIYFKQYIRFPKIKLDKDIVWNKNKELLIKSIFERKSYNIHKDKLHSISKEDLSNIFLSCAISKNYKDIKYDSRRTYPSAGARYPLELYILIQKSDSIKHGLYHYNVKLHALEYMWKMNKKDIHKIFKQDFSTKCSGIIIITSVINRSTIKYGERGYTFSYIEAGHIGQNIALLSESIGLKCRPFGIFDNKRLTEFLDINTKEEIIIYTLAIA
jgi:SagB-type dehydrogenase family enzyme